MTQRKKTRTAVVEKELSQAPLSSAEEQVVRMRRGLPLADEEQLEIKATPNEKARQALLAMEKEIVFKLQAEQRQRKVQKKKIVDSLRSTKK